MRTTLAASAVLAAAGLAAAQPCTVGWQPDPIGNPGLSGPARGIAVHQGVLYVGGPFLNAGGILVNGVGRWDGASWNALGGGLTGANPTLPTPVNCLGSHTDGGGPALYAGGSFLNADGAPAARIAKWNGVSWSPLASGLDSGAALGIGSFNGELYVGGSFTAASGVPGTTNLARWDGAAWAPVGGGIAGGSCNTFLVHDDGSGLSLFAGGMFTSADGVPGTVRIARWDGTRWHALGTGVEGGTGPRVNAMAVYNDGSGPALFVGGIFTTAGGVNVSNLAKWDGTNWFDVGGGTDGNVTRLAVFDDGRGPGLYVGGSFANVGGPAPVLVNGIARWNGTSWVDLDGGVTHPTVTTVTGLAVLDDGGGGGESLFVSGGFTTAGGQATNNVARWGCAATTCYANCDGSTTNPVLNVSDFICFQTRYAANDPYANCDNSTTPPVLNVSDFICFQTAYSAGCP